MRFNDLKKWLASIDAAGDITLASGDASFRRYYRVRQGTTSFIVMDAPPDKEDSVPFVRVAGFLESMQLNAPRVLEADLEQGFLLLSDLGETQYLETLQRDPGAADRLYADAMSALMQLQRRGTAYQSQLPPYDEKLLRFELSLFHDWLCGRHLGIEMTGGQEAAWTATCDMLVENAIEQPQVFVHRDYHSRNLMVTPPHNPGILDFQDAVEGPFTYDLVSLLKDCYVHWPPERVLAWATGFYEQSADTLPADVSRKRFLRFFELMGVQRQLKAAGIFARLNHRDAKPGYLAEVPRTLSYVLELGPRYAELDDLCDIIERQVLPGLGGRP